MLTFCFFFLALNVNDSDSDDRTEDSADDNLKCFFQPSLHVVDNC